MSKKIFTKGFFELNNSDQGAVVNALLAEIRNQCYVNHEDEAKARRQANRIEKKAVEYGVLAGTHRPNLAMISIALSATDRLHLTEDEADRLADQIGKEMVCRTAAQADGLIMVADIPLTAAEAWQLLDRLEDPRDGMAKLIGQAEGF